MFSMFEMFGEKETQNKEKKQKKQKQPKNTIKLSDSSYIEVVQDKNCVMVYKVDRIENLFSEGFKEERIKLLPEKELKSSELTEKMTECINKLTDKVEGLSFKLSDYGSNIGTITGSIDIQTVNNTIQNFSKLVEDEIIKREKTSRYKKLIKSDYFSAAKKLEIFKGKSDIELAEILIELSKGYSKAAGEILEKIKTEEALDNV